MKTKKLITATRKAIKSIFTSIPIIIGMVLLISLLSSIFGNDVYTKLFTNNNIIDPLIGSFFGSILAGNPITSFVIAGELQRIGISTIAITAFLVAWVTVGLVQLPAESIHLGKKFTYTRNALALISSILIAILTTLVVSLV
ncbi:MAG: hypothetical protein ACOCQQ_02375, partial [Candidatus Nanoarchaeia archaeon]